MERKFHTCKENHRVQSKILGVSISIQFCYYTEIGCFRTRRCTLAHIRPFIFLTYNDTKFIVETSQHSPIQRYFCHKHDGHGTKADY